MEPSDLEEKIAFDTLERYTGSKAEEYQPNILLTNFSSYVDEFSKLSGTTIQQGSTMTSCHWPEKQVSMLDFKVGSPAAAMAIDMLAFVKPKSCLMLGMCGGLRRKYTIGEYLLPVAGIRGEGTSDYYWPRDIPALSNFVIQKAISNVLDKSGHKKYYIGIVHSTNIRMWEFNQEFRQMLIDEKVQGVEMECATLFAAGYKRDVPVGALMLISDLPLNEKGIKTKESSKSVTKTFAAQHVKDGIDVVEYLISNAIEQT